MDDEIRQRLCLGIDLGTTSVKIYLLDKDSKDKIHTFSKQSHAGVKSDIGVNGSEQNPHQILSALKDCIESIKPKHRGLIDTICVTGQMHGVMLWSHQSITNHFVHQFEIGKGDNSDIKLSNLYTWQDQRCSHDFLSSLPKPDSHLPLATGHGCATLLWLNQHQNQMMTIGFNCCGTVMDYLVAGLCGLNKPVTSVQLAASFGYFNTREKSWNYSQLTEAGLPVELLPYVVCAGHKAGTLQCDWLGIKRGTHVLAALGDVQCAVYSVLKSANDAVLNMSTSCQLAFSVSSDELVPLSADSTCPIQYFPYFEESYLAIAASLNGGNVLAHFISMLSQWLSCFGFEVEEDKLWSTLGNLSMKSTESESLTILPTLFGERHNPQQAASVSGITRSNLDLGTVFRSMCCGLLDNLSNMMPVSFLEKNKITNLIGSGSLLSRNEVMRQEVERHYGNLTIEFGNSCDSATGAAMYAAKYCRE